MLRIIDEATAEARAYGLNKKASGERNVLNYDMDEDICDLSINLTTENCISEARTIADGPHLGSTGRVLARLLQAL